MSSWGHHGRLRPTIDWHLVTVILLTLIFQGRVRHGATSLVAIPLLLLLLLLLLVSGWAVQI
jgi:hypothetical protein